MRHRSDTTATGRAYREIKSRILDSTYRAGQKLSETRLCAELELGRSPIRTALARLKEEGWIAVSPQSGTYVRSLSGEEIEEVIELRLLLETHVAAKAAQHIDPASLRSLQQLLARLGPEIVKGDLEAFLELDGQIHSAIYDAAGNALVGSILDSLREKVRWLLPPTASALERRHALRELERILDALKRRDPALAAKRMREHVGDAAAFYKKIGNVPPGRRRESGASPGSSAPYLQARSARR